MRCSSLEMNNGSYRSRRTVLARIDAGSKRTRSRMVSSLSRLSYAHTATISDPASSCYRPTEAGNAACRSNSVCRDRASRERNQDTNLSSPPLASDPADNGHPGR